MKKKQLKKQKNDNKGNSNMITNLNVISMLTFNILDAVCLKLTWYNNGWYLQYSKMYLS